MKQSTTFACVANKFSKVLQGYTKGIRFVAVLTMLLTLGIGQAWGETWEKVTSAPTDWSGDYLIVYEDGEVAFDGSRTTLDAASNTFSVTISNGKITTEPTTGDTKYFTIAKSGTSYTIKSESGYYIGQTSNANGLKSHTSTSYANTISLEVDGSVNLVSGGAYLRYNPTYSISNGSQTGLRFRYYKSSSYTNQKAICLYKKVASCTAPTSVSISGEWGYFAGETISLTATPTGGGTPTGYQWYKNGTAISGATSSTYSKSNCTDSDAGNYTCKVSTGATCSTTSSAFVLRVYSLQNYTDGTTTHNFTRVGTTKTGTVEVVLTNNKQYEFKIFAGNSLYLGNNGTINADISNWVFETNTNNVKLNSGLGGTFIFTIDYSSDSSKPKISITYPRKDIYMACGSTWCDATPTFFAHAWRNGGTETYDVKLAQAPCESSIYIAENIPAYCSHVIFTRQKPGSTELEWSGGTNFWNQSEDITISTNDLFTCTGWSNGKGTFSGGTYTPPTYTITFSGNGNTSGSMSNVTGIPCEGYTTLVANGYTRTGYTFNGWKDGGGNTYADKATISNITSNITLTAQWTPITYDVKFNANNGSGSMSNQTFTYDAAQNLTANAFSRTGYLFAGWNTKADGSGTSYVDKASVKNLSSTNGAIVNLYAQWTPITYSINWVVNGAPYENGGSTEAVHNSTYNDLTLPTPPEGSELEACYDNKVFVGWSTTDVGYVETNTKPTLLAEVPTTSITENKTFYAVFATVTESDGGTTTVAHTITETFENQTASTTYNTTKTYDAGNSNAGIAWEMFYGTVSASDVLNGNQSAQMRWYDSAPNNLPYIRSTTKVNDLKSISFKTLTSANTYTYSVLYSTDGTNWTAVATGQTVGSTSVTQTKSYTINNNGIDAFIKIAVTAATTDKAKFRIDDVVFTYLETTAGSTTTETTGYVSKCYCVTEIALSMTGGHQNLDVGDTNQLLVTYTPDDATCGNEIATWTSSNNNVISVDSEGLVTANMAGNATITATTTNGISNTYNIEVNNPACEAWYLHYWNASITGDECFYKVKPDDDSDHEWRTNNFSLPSNSDEDQFIVLNANGVDAYQANQIFRTSIGFADIQRGGQNCGSNPYPGQDAWGQLSIYDDSESTNRYIAFYPAQYMVTFGQEGGTWIELPLTNTTDYEYESEPFTVPNGYKTDEAYKYWVGITKRDGDIHFVDGKSSVDAMNTVNGLSAEDMAGKWGVWHIWSNSCANNWYGEFIRYYRVDFDLNGGEGYIAPRYGKTTTPYATFSTNDITAPTRDGYIFLGWKDQNNKIYAPTDATVTINNDLTLTALWVEEYGSDNCRWEEVTIDNIVYGDEVVIAMAHGEDLYALPYDTKTASNDNPLALKITSANLASAMSEDLIWYIMKGDGNTFTLSPKTAINKYLTCNSSNNAVRIDTDSERYFTIDNDFLKNTNFNTYLAISLTASPPDWRHFSEKNSTIANKFQTLKFYKKVCLPEGQYRVTWDANGGAWSDGSTTKEEIYTEGADINLPEEPELDGYKFDSWEPTPSTMPAENTTFTAQWAELHTITWMVGSSSVLSEDVANGTGVTKTPASNPEGDAIGDCADTFLGWSEKSAGSTPQDADYYDDLCSAADMKSKHTSVTGDKTFYAVFATKGSGGIAQGTVLWAENFAHFGTNTPSTAGTGTGTTIYGDASITYSQSSNNTKGYDEEIAGGTKPELLLYKGGNHTWTIAGIPTGGATKMTLSFLSNKTTFNVTSSTAGITISGSQKTWNIETNDEVTTFTLTIKNTGGDNARLDNVSLVVSEGGISYSNYVTNCCALAPATNLTVSGTTANSATLTWTAPSPTTGITKLQVRDENGNVKVDNLAANATTATITGLSECTEYKYYVVSVGDCEVVSNTITAQPFSGAKTVTFNPNGGSVSPTSFTTSCTNKSTNLPIPTYSGYRFMGWFTAESGGTEIDDNPYTPTEDITLFAHWEKEYTVTYDLQGGTAIPVCSGDKYIAGEIVTICTSTPIKSGYKFTGWTYSPVVTITNGQFTMPASNVTITAEFVARAVTNIEVATNTHRVLMQGSAFIGEQIRVTYDNGETELLEWSNSKLTFTGHNTNELGVQTVTVTYTGEGTAHTQYNIEVIDGLGITFWDGDYTETIKYEPGDLVNVDNKIGQSICDGWKFVGWSETKVANESNGFTPVHNFNATDAKVLYAVYVQTSTDWISAYNIDELHPGAKYIIIAHYSSDNEYALTNTSTTNASYLDGAKLTTVCEQVQEGDAYPYKDRYKLKVTPDENWKWQLENTGSSWTMRNIKANKYLKVNSDKTISLTATPDDKFTFSNGYNDSEITALSSSNNYLSWYNSSKYWNGHTSGQQYYLTNETNFTSTPPCSPLSATFHGNGGIVTDGVNSGDDLTITEPTRDAGITTPTASFADCNGKSWTFVGWAREEIDVTCVPVLTTDLLHDGGGNKHYDIQEDGEEFWAVFTNIGNPETKYGTITFTDADVTRQYENAKTITKSVTAMGDYDFELYHVSDASSLGIQFDHNSTPKGYIKNITSLGKINSISLNDFLVGDIDDVKVYVGNTPDAINIPLTEVDLQQTGNTYTYYPQKNYAYVKIEANGYCGITSISIDFGKGTQIWATTPDCSTITLSGDELYVTSTNGQSIRAAERLTVKAVQLESKAKVVISSNSSDIYFSDVQDANFTQAVKPTKTLTLPTDVDGNLSATDIYVHYRPSVDGTGIPEDVVVSANLETPNPSITDDHTIHVRNLPADFIIAAKWGDNWYAMSADMNSQSSTNGWLIKVDDAANPTKAFAAPNTTKYGLKSVYTSNSSADRYADNGERLVFVENVDETTPVANKTLYNGGGSGTSNTNIQVNAQYSGYYSTNPDRYEWIPTTTNMQDYTLTSAHRFTKDDATLENARTVSMDNHGEFGTLLQDKAYNGMVRLLPVDNFYETVELQVVEWKQNSVSVMYTGAGTKYTTQVGNNAESSVQELSSIDHAVYSLSTADLTSATNQPLIITIKDNTEATIGAIKLIIPAIVAADKTTTELGVAEENAKATSIVVLDGATLTADATKYTYDDITVYPGGNLIIDDGKSLGMYTLTLRAGLSWGAEEYEHKYPQFLLRGEYSNTSGQINLDYVTTADYYYPLSVPEEVTIDDIKYPVEIYGSNVDKANKGSFQFKYYKGAQRATGATGWVVVDEETTTTLMPNQGYAIWGIPKKVSVNGGAKERQKYGIHRIPIKIAADKLLDHEIKNELITIQAYAAARPNDQGWNYLGNPYLVGLGSMDGSDEDLLIGLLEKEMVDGKWTGGWVYNEESVNNKVRYITITNDCQNFEALPVANAKISPFTTFFIQAASVDDQMILLTVPASVLNVSSLPARHYAAQQETAKEITTGIILTGNDQTDRTGLLIADNFTEEYDFNADLSKFENSGINLYTIGKDGKLAFMAINQALAEQPIPLGYGAPADGEYTIAFDEDRYNATDISALYLIDYDSNEKTNLLHTDYSFVTAAGTNNERFALQVAFIPQNATSVEWVDDATIQVAVDGNNLLLNNLPTDAAVQVFDALGRLMYHAPTVPTDMQLTLPTGYYLVRIANKQHTLVIDTIIP